jgi:hypothetical protein
MADKKVTELTAITNLSGDDLLLVVNDPLGTPGSRKITVDNVFGNVATNASFTGDRVTFSANLYYQGSELNSIIDTKISVANAAVDTTRLDSRIDLVNTNLTGTNTAIRTLVNDRMQVANTTALVNDRLQVANAAATYTPLSTYTAFISLLSVKATSPIVNATNNANTPVIKVSSATGLQCTKGLAPSSNNAATEGVPVGTIFFSNNHLYIATDATTIKRVSLEVFS